MPRSAVLDGSDFSGRTRSFTSYRGAGAGRRAATAASTIYPQRFESTKVRSIGGARLTVDKFRCRCGKGHEVRRPLEAAAA